VLALAAGIVAYFLVPPPLPEASRQELLEEVRAGTVGSVTVVDGAIIRAESARRGEFRVVLPPDDDSLIEELTALGVKIEYETTPLGLI
jgi:hypothetical protein